MRRLLALLLTTTALLPACGGADAPGAGLTVAFTVSRGAAPLPCAEVAEITAMSLRLRDASGRLLAGVSQQVECAAGAVTVTGAPAGEYTMELVATGALSGDPEAVLFKATQAVTVPGSYDVVLDPQVAYLTLGWTFGEGDLGPCGTEVDEVGVIVSTGAGQVGGYMATFGCTETPVVLPQPFDLREYVIQVEARSAEGFPLFTHTASRILDRGQNTYTANLMPLGGQVFLDWAFAVRPEDMPVRMCDAASVQVDTLSVMVESLEGGAPVTEEVACTAPMRPYAFTKARFTPGRRLALVVSAEGQERFWAREEFVMPAGDRIGDRLTLTAVGTASVAAVVRTASCAPDREGVDLVVLRRGADPSEAQAVSIDAEAPGATLSALYYGTYDVQASVRTAQGARCARAEVRAVTQREQAWAPIIF